MSTRIKVLLSHPDYGPLMGNHAFRAVEKSFTESQQSRMRPFLVPLELAGWPRWKRCLWMTKHLGLNWKLRLFRERRGTKTKTSRFWKAAEELGFPRPRKRQQKQVVLENGNRLYIAGAGLQQDPGEAVWRQFHQPAQVQPVQPLEEFPEPNYFDLPDPEVD